MSPPHFSKSLAKYFVEIKENSDDYWVKFSIPNEKLKKIDIKIQKCLRKQNFKFWNAYEVSVPVGVNYCVLKQKKPEPEKEPLVKAIGKAMVEGGTHEINVSGLPIKVVCHKPIIPEPEPEKEYCDDCQVEINKINMGRWNDRPVCKMCMLKRAEGRYGESSNKEEPEDELSELEKYMMEQNKKKEEFLKKGFEYWKQKRINFWKKYVNSKQTKKGFKENTHALGMRLTNLAKIPMKRMKEEWIPKISKHLEEETDDNWERWVGADYESW